MRLHETHRTERNGLPVLWANAPGPVVAVLLFRVGRADEPLAYGGLTHLVEHMALFPLGKRPYEYNGRVEETFTAFVVSGSLDEVTRFLTDVGAALSGLPLDRIGTERRILATEALGAEPGIVERLLGLRFGPNHYGLVMNEELGLGWLRAEDATAWAGQRFTAENAVLWMSAEPPADLAIPLARGERIPPPVPEPIGTLRLPAYIQQGRGGVALSVLTERSSEVHAGFLIGLERARERLRIQAGLSYAVTGSYIPLDGRLTHITAGADCMDREAATVRDHLIATFDELAAEGPTEEELDWDRAQIRRGYEDPTTVFATLDAQARDLLAGVEPFTSEAILRERDALTPAAVADAVREALGSLLVVVPAEIPWTTDRFTEYEVANRDVVPGTRHRTTDDARAAGDVSEIVAGGHGVTYVVPPDDYVVTARWEDCLAAVPGLSGSVVLATRQGAGVRVYPYRYTDGEGILAEISRGVPRERWVPLTDRERELQPIVERELGRPEIAHLDQEIDVLANVLTWDEQLAHLAEARFGEVRGLLAVTDARAMFLFIGGQETFIEKPLAGLAAQVKGTFKKRLVLTDAAGTIELAQVNPPGRLEEIVERVSQPVGAASVDDHRRSE